MKTILTHCVVGPDGTDVGNFDSAETAELFARDGEIVATLNKPVTREDCRPVKGGGVGVW